jgi:putative FmdB family regulatory protein
MPIYEYRCESCGYELEIIQKISELPLTECPECGAPRLKKLLSAAGFRLKGSGWYETDFKKGGTQRNLHDPGATASKGENKPAKTEAASKTPAPAASPLPAKPAASS